jgi:hypothetical protein
MGADVSSLNAEGSLSTSVLQHAGHYENIVQARDMKGRNR